MQFVKRKVNSKLLHEVETPKKSKVEEVWLDCEDWLPAVVDTLNKQYEFAVPVLAADESDEEELSYVPAQFDYKCYSPDEGEVILWTRWFNVGEVWSKRIKGLNEPILVWRGEHIPPEDEVNSMVDGIIKEIERENEKETYPIEINKLMKKR